jgi:hypothetical protein
MERPAHRRYSVDIGATPAAPVRWGDTHPSLQGWEISWRTTHSSDFAMIQGILTARDDWYEGASLEFGDQNAAPAFTQGGTVFVPYQFVAIQLYGANGVGDANVQLYGRPILCGETQSRASSHLINCVPWSVDHSSTTSVTVPSNATSFVVTRSEPDATPLLVAATGLDSEVFQAFELNNDSLGPGSVSAMPWRPTPWSDNSGTGTIDIENNDGANAANGQVYFLFDLTRGR